MTYEKRIDELVGQHVKSFVAELSRARAMGALMAKRKVLPMPYGYPIRVYRPMHICRAQTVRTDRPLRETPLSNGVPSALRTRFVGHYILGVYNPGGNGCR